LRNKKQPKPQPETKQTASAAGQQKRPAHQFQPGTSGNPGGRKVGQKNRATALAEQMLNGEAEAVVRALLHSAKNGDTAAAMFVVRRLVPVRHGYPVQIDLPPIASADDLVKALSLIAQQMAEGKLTPEEASQAVNVLEVQRKARETSDLAQRLAELEAFRERQERQRR
jgi:hypothetical protein